LTTTPLNRSLEPLGVSIPSKVPTHWYNLAADLPEPVPPHLHPGTREPLGPEDLAPLFPMNLIAQEVATERYIEIPETVREIYGMWRPSPLFRAHRLERALGTPARIYYKYEGVSPVGSHKPNTAVAQAYYNAIEGTTKLTTETGAGQWGASLSFAGALLGLDVEVWRSLVLRFEAVPTHPDGGVRRNLSPVAFGPDGSRTRTVEVASRHHRLAWYGDQ